MSAPRDTDLLFRCGGATLLKYGVPWRRTRWDPLEAESPTFSRADAATCATYFGPDGLLRVALANRLRLDYGDPAFSGGAALLLEGARTNVCLQNRDLTNGAWTKVSVTPVKDQTGLDGIANSASRITASAGNGTCLQAIALGSSARAQSAYIKRLVGSGNIQMTMDNGGTWTTVAVTAAWTRVAIPTQTIANPTVGFRIVTNGDSVAIDYVQNENGTYPTSPIAVAGSAVTRAADSLVLPIGFSQPILGATHSVYARFAPLWPLSGWDGLAPGVFVIGTGTFAADGKSAMDAHRSTGSAQLTARLHANDVTSSLNLNLPGAGPLELLLQAQPVGSLHQLYAELTGGVSGTGATLDLASFPWRALSLTPGNRGNGNDPGQIRLLDLMVARGAYVTTDFAALP